MAQANQRARNKINIAMVERDRGVQPELAYIPPLFIPTSKTNTVNNNNFVSCSYVSSHLLLFHPSILVPCVAQNILYKKAYLVVEENQSHHIIQI